MKCPKCDALLNEITRAGVLVDVCPRCLGMWLERGELEKIAARLREVERDRDDDERHPGGPGPFRPYDDDRRRYDDDPRRYPKKKRWTDLFEIFD
jgi:Zn-finger nucleic acid-binding protein